ncbi:MAG: Arc family DNA binding domain-containing protein [Pseudomonadota bacterium]
MAKRKAFALRINESILDSMQIWADDDLRSLNAQIEFVLRDALRRAGRMPPPSRADTDGNDSSTSDG